MASSNLKPPLAPRYWPGWLLLAVLWLWSRLPFAWAMRLPGWLEPLFRKLLKKRLPVVRRNLQACFPELDEKAREALLTAHLRQVARMPFQTLYGWWHGKKFIRQVVDLRGYAHLTAAAGRGVILLIPHSTGMEMCTGRLTCETLIAAMYRPHKNPLMEYIVRRGREAKGVEMIAKDNVRQALRYLRKGGAIFYTADMDVRGEQSLFAPFFGIQTATLTAPLRLAKAGRAVILPMLPVCLDNNRYQLRILPPLPELSGDDLADLTMINKTLEDMIREIPDQYWWLHRRFKTRPDGEAEFYS